jgi:hypothetical protein
MGHPVDIRRTLCIGHSDTFKFAEGHSVVILRLRGTPGLCMRGSPQTQIFSEVYTHE